MFLCLDQKRIEKTKSNLSHFGEAMDQQGLLHFQFALRRHGVQQRPSFCSRPSWSYQLDKKIDGHVNRSCAIFYGLQRGPIKNRMRSPVWQDSFHQLRKKNGIFFSFKFARQTSGRLCHEQKTWNKQRKFGSSHGPFF